MEAGHLRDLKSTSEKPLSVTEPPEQEVVQAVINREVERVRNLTTTDEWVENANQEQLIDTEVDEWRNLTTSPVDLVAHEETNLTTNPVEGVKEANFTQESTFRQGANVAQ